MQRNVITLVGIGSRTLRVRLTLMKAVTSLYLIKIAWRMGGLIQSFCIGGGLQEIVICLSLIQKGFSTWCGTEPGHLLVIPFHSTMCNRCSAFLPRYVFSLHTQWMVLLTTDLKSLLLFSLFHDGESQSLGTSVASLFVWSLWMFVWGSEKLPFCTYVFLLIMCWSRSCFLGSNAKCWRLVYLLWTIKSCSCSSEKAFI